MLTDTQASSTHIKPRRKIAIIFLLAILVIVLLLSLFLSGIIKINTPSAAQYPVHGVDVSEYQGDIDWVRIEEQGIHFAFIKATEGSGYTDPYFSQNWGEIADTDILYGAYHFFSFDSSALTQAEYFCSVVPKHPGMLPPVVDIELYGEHKQNPPPQEKVRDELNTMLTLLEQYYGVKPILYVTQASYKLYLSGYYQQYPLWIRDVYFTPRLPQNETWTFWQYSAKGLLSGYDGPEKYIDLNVYSGSVGELKEMRVG